MNDKYYIGIDIGGTKCAVIAGTTSMEILDKIKFPTETDKGPEYTLNNINNNLENLISKFGKSDLKAIGISCGGPLDSKRGIILSPPNLPGWDNIHITN
ncbi:MAG: ROK family protein, partial [Ignavibacteriales bacterium]|nr:ROK family protein [Ignavibacteriales bacterium]